MIGVSGGDFNRRIRQVKRVSDRSYIEPPSPSSHTRVHSADPASRPWHSTSQPQMRFMRMLQLAAWSISHCSLTCINCSVFYVTLSFSINNHYMSLFILICTNRCVSGVTTDLLHGKSITVCHTLSLRAPILQPQCYRKSVFTSLYTHR